VGRGKRVRGGENEKNVKHARQDEIRPFKEGGGESAQKKEGKRRGKNHSEGTGKGNSPNLPLKNRTGTRTQEWKKQRRGGKW